MTAPLTGFAMLDVGTLTPGKYCSGLLADLGIDVVRIERPQPSSPISDEDLVLNQGKRSMTVNLRTDAGRAVFMRLAERTDVILESNRPGVADRNGFGYQAVRARNPRVVYCALSGYGASGPQSGAPGYDLIFAAQCGMLKALTGESARPFPPDAYLADAVSGLTAAFAIVTSLLAREHSNQGGFVDLAMHDSLFALLAVSHGVRRPGEKATTPARTPTYAVYPAAARTWLALGAIRPASASALFRHLGRPELAEPDADPHGVESFLNAAFAARPADAWVAELTPLDVEVAAVNEPFDAYDDAQLRAREMIARVEHPAAGGIETIRPAFSVSGTKRQSPASPAPHIGADTDAILAALGFDDRDVAGLHESGVV